MSLPNIPNINSETIPEKRDSINLLLNSITAEEIGFSNIIRAQVEEIQRVLKDPSHRFEDLYLINASLAETLRLIASNQLLLQFKLTDTIKLDQHDHTIYED